MYKGSSECQRWAIYEYELFGVKIKYEESAWQKNMMDQGTWLEMLPH